MKTISFEIDDKTMADLSRLAQMCTEHDQDSGGSTSHGPLDVPGLLAMLAEDAAKVVSRPGSWEGAGMGRQFESHGYDV